MTFNTGNKAADKLLDVLGEEFIAMPWYNDDGGVEFVTLVDDESKHAVAIKFADRGEPEFVLTDMTFAVFGDEENDDDE